MSDFEIVIDRLMLDCTTKGLSQKTMKLYEQTLQLFPKWLEENFKIDNGTITKGDYLVLKLIAEQCKK